jgi:hypothetical protein
MAHRNLLRGYSRLPGSSKRVRTPGGSIISDRAYNTIVNTQLQQSGEVAKSARALAVARKVAKDTPTPVKGRLFSILSENGTVHRARFDDAALKEARDFRTAIGKAYGSKFADPDLAPLREWRERNPDGLKDVTNKRQRFLSTKTKHKHAWGNMSERARAKLEERYAETGVILSCDCGEYHPSALTRRNGKYVCGNCYARTRGWPEIRLCVSCTQQHPCEKHHKHGWRVSKLTEFHCVNCHRKLHKGRAI